MVRGLAATRRSVYIHQMNRVNSRNYFCDDDSTINIVVVIVIIIIIIIKRIQQNASIGLLHTVEIWRMQVAYCEATNSHLSNDTAT